jgi:hypothetical protein
MAQGATIDATNASAKLASSRVTESARSGAESVQMTLATANRGGADLAAFWLKVMQEQTEQNIEAMRRLAGAQTCEEKLAVQSSFLSGSLARMQDVFTRYIELASTMTGDMLNTRTGKIDKAG